MKTPNRYYDPATKQFDKAAIMRDAWNGLVRNTIRQRLSMRLSVIWSIAKAEKLDAEQSRDQAEARRLRTTAELIQHKTTMTEADHQQVQLLRSRADDLSRAA